MKRVLFGARDPCSYGAVLGWLIAASQAAVWLLLAAAGAVLLRAASWAFGRKITVGEAPPIPANAPRVTVQLPIRNERFVAERVLRAACALDWPRERLQIQALDDSDEDDETRAILDRVAAELRAAGHDVSVLRRPTREGFKAGNLTHGLQFADGELIAVLDADCVPPRDWLRRVCAPLAADPRLGFAQGRWSFDNERENLLTRVQALILDGLMLVEQSRLSQQRKPLQFNGSGGVWRRAALDAAGGWLGAAGASVTEDLDLSFRARLAGWIGVLVEDATVATELPAGMGAFRAQQERWVRGAGQVLRGLGRLPSSGALTIFAHLLRHARQPLLVALALWLAPVALGCARPAFDLPYVWPALLTFLYFSISLYYGAARARVGRSAAAGFALAPLIMVLSIGLSLPLAVAFLRGLFGGRAATWVRTPKTGAQNKTPQPTLENKTPENETAANKESETKSPENKTAENKKYRAPFAPLALVEVAVAAAYGAATVAVAARGDYASAAGLALVAAGFGWVGAGSLFN